MVTKPPSSLVANILLKRIETKKPKFEELYADLDILEQNITEKDYHFPSLEKPLREKFEQFKPKFFLKRSGIETWGKYRLPVQSNEKLQVHGMAPI